MGGLFGGGGGSSGGGGVSLGGANAYPNHQIAVHEAWLYGQATGSPTLSNNLNVYDEMEKASTFGGGPSPYASATAYSPDGDLSAIEAKIMDVISDIDGLDPTTDIGQAILFAIDKIEDELMTDSEIGDLVDAFEERQKGAHARAATRIAAGMYDIGAVNCSAFTMAMANLEDGRQQELNDADTKLRLEMKQQRLQTLLGLAQQWLQRRDQKIAGRQAVAGMQDAHARLVIAAKQDEIGFDLQVLEKDRRWNLDLFPYGNNVMSSIAGSATVPHPTQWERKIDAAATIASATTNWVGTNRSTMFPAVRSVSEMVGNVRANNSNMLSNLLGFGSILTGL